MICTTYGYISKSAMGPKRKPVVSNKSFRQRFHIAEFHPRDLRGTSKVNPKRPLADSQLAETE